MAVVYILNANNLSTDLSLYENIDKNRLEKINKSSNILFKKEQLGSSILLNDILENYFFMDTTKVEYIYNEFGKPYIKDSNLYFSLSHSNGVIALAVSKEEIGLDIELIKDVKDNLAHKVMNEAEYNIYKGLSKTDKISYFYEVWTSKEAYVKKLGSALTLNPSNINIDSDVILKNINISNSQYMIALTDATYITIDERYIPKELLERKK